MIHSDGEALWMYLIEDHGESAVVVRYDMDVQALRWRM